MLGEGPEERKEIMVPVEEKRKCGGGGRMWLLTGADGALLSASVRLGGRDDST